MSPYILISSSLFVVAIFNGFLSFFILQKNSHHRNLNKAVFVLGLSTALFAFFSGIVYLRAGLGLDYNFYYRACHIGWFALPAIFQISCYVKDDKSRQALIGGTILYVVWGIIDTLNLTTNWIETGVNSLIPFIPRYGPFEKPMRFMGATMLVWIICRLFKARKDITGIRKAQLNYFILGTMIYAIGGSLGAGFFSLFGGFGIDPALVPYFSLPWIGLTVYAITRYKLFDIQIILSSTLTVAILILGLGGLHIGVFNVLEPYLGSNWAILISIAVVIIIFLRTPLIMKVQGGLNSVFLGDKYRYQEILKESTKAIVSILDQDELLNYLINAIQQSFKIRKACLFLKTPQGSYALRYDWGIDKKVTAGYELSNNNIIAWLKQTKDIFIKEEQEEILSQAEFKQVYGDLGHIESELIIPLFFKENLVGFFTLGRKDDQRPYVQSDIDILETLASQAAIAIENSRLYNEAITDGLTGLYHHKYFMMRINEEMERCKRNKAALSLLMIDIDHFKNINDTLGHLAGDHVLAATSHLIKNGTRAIDIVARYGGEEFVALLPETDKAGALVVAERLRKAIEERSFENNIKVTISIGVNSYYGLAKIVSMHDFIDRTDKALYQAKQNGRNRIEVAAV